MKRYLFFVILGVIDPKNSSNRHSFQQKNKYEKIQVVIICY